MIVQSLPRVLCLYSWPLTFPARVVIVPQTRCLGPQSVASQGGGDSHRQGAIICMRAVNGQPIGRLKQTQDGVNPLKILAQTCCCDLDL
jgi:hypothetical protein